MLTLKLNGQEQPLDQSRPLPQALADWGYQGKIFAVAVNGTFVPRSRYADTMLKPGDSVEVVAPMSGG